MNRTWLVLIAAALIVPAWAEEPSRRKGPLAGLPSEPGPRIKEIQALGDNEWLPLGKPTPDPKWGSARGRTWSANQPAAPNLGGGFVFAEGVHGFTKPDGRYMNDLWFYDINGHRWICAYPGIEVKAVAQRIKDGELTLNANGLLVDKGGEPLPPLLIHAYGNLGYDPERKKFLTFGGQFGNYFTWGKREPSRRPTGCIRRSGPASCSPSIPRSCTIPPPASSSVRRSSPAPTGRGTSGRTCWPTSVAGRSSSTAGRTAYGISTPARGHGPTPNRRASRRRASTIAPPTTRSATACTTTSMTGKPRKTTSWSTT